MSGDHKKGAPDQGEPSSNDDHLPLIEPGSFHELDGPRPAPKARASSDFTEASEPPGIAVDISSAMGEEVTEGQLIDHVPSPAAVAKPVPSPRDSSDTDAPESRLGTTLAGRYRLERVIAKGGMGRVYLATQLPLERQVAIKLLVNQRFDAEFRKRFFLEASTCARLVHRHIVTVHDYGEADNGELFMAMEYLDGVPLSKMIQRQVRLPSERACKIALQACRALRAAHKTGVVHRDLKPGNVIVLTDEDQDGNDFIKVLDFGLVKAFEGGAVAEVNDLTKSGTWLGSPRYMAPEQIRCQPVDPRTDIYSLGVILFHMLAGRPPFIGANSMEVLEQHLRDKPPSIADVLGRSDYAPELEVIVERCLKKDASLRYQSMDELIGDLKAAYRLITGVSLHTESTLPTFAEIADPSLAFPPSTQVPMPVPTASFNAPPVETMAMSDPSASGPQSARVTGTVRAPLELLEHSNPGGAREMVFATPVDESQSSMGTSVAGGLPYVQKTSNLRWFALAAALVLVMLAGFFSVKLFGPQAPAIVRVSIDSQPRGADVLLEGQRIGVTPMVYPMSDVVANDVRTFVVRKPGHEDARLTTRLDRERVDLHAPLVRLPDPVAEPVRVLEGSTADPEPSLREPPRREARVDGERRRVPRRKNDGARARDRDRELQRERQRARERERQRARERERQREARRAAAKIKKEPAVEQVPNTEDPSVRIDERRDSLIVEREGSRVVKESEVPVVE